jgi:hypothetical protein
LTTAGRAVDVCCRDLDFVLDGVTGHVGPNVILLEQAPLEHAETTTVDEAEKILEILPLVVFLVSLHLV